MCSAREQHFLSYDELLLVCELSKTNCALWNRTQEHFAYLGSITGHGGDEALLIALGANRQRRVRGHFQRLIPTTRVAGLEAIVQRAHAQREKELKMLADLTQREHLLAQYETDSMTQEDARSNNLRPLETAIQSQDEYEESPIYIKHGLSIEEEEHLSASLGVISDTSKVNKKRRQDHNEGIPTQINKRAHEHEQRTSPVIEKGQRPEQDADEETPAAAKVRKRREEWLSMFRLQLQPNRKRKHIYDLLIEAAQRIADHLRDAPTMPAHPSDASKPWLEAEVAGRLPPVSCALKGCTWLGGTLSRLKNWRTTQSILGTNNYAPTCYMFTATC